MIDDSYGLRTDVQLLTTEPIENHESLMNRLGVTRQHSIVLVELAENTRPYTCFQHAFGLVDPTEPVLAIMLSPDGAYASRAFVEFLIRSVLTEVTASTAGLGDVVLYSSEGTVRHAAVIDGDRVISKWGEGHLWRHNLLEVPTSYGSELRYFRAIDPSVAEAAFIRFSAEKSS